MLFLNFQIGDDGFALATDRIVEIVPMVALRKVRDAPAAIAGSLEFRDRFVPVIDVCELELARAARWRLSTRIIVTRLGGGLAGDAEAMIGLIAEHVTATMRCDLADFAPFVAGARGLVQYLDLETLVPGSLRAFLSRPGAGEYPVAHP